MSATATNAPTVRRPENLILYAHCRSNHPSHSFRAGLLVHGCKETKLKLGVAHTPVGVSLQQSAAQGRIVVCRHKSPLVTDHRHVASTGPPFLADAVAAQHKGWTFSHVQIICSCFGFRDVLGTASNLGNLLEAINVHK